MIFVRSPLEILHTRRKFMLLYSHHTNNSHHNIIYSHHTAIDSIVALTLFELFAITEILSAIFRQIYVFIVYKRIHKYMTVGKMLTFVSVYSIVDIFLEKFVADSHPI